MDKNDRRWTIRRFISNNNNNDKDGIIAARNNIPYQREIIRKHNNYEKVEHISPEQPYRLKPENGAQITKDNPGDIFFELNHISPCISPEGNGENHAQNEHFRRSGDTGDICYNKLLSFTLPLPYSLFFGI